MGMRASTIRLALKHQVEDWLKSIEDETVRLIARNNVIVTGGAISSMLLGERVNDYDIYFKTKEATIAVAEYYVKKYVETNKLEAKTTNPFVPVVKVETRKNIKGDLEERVFIWIQSAGAVGETQGEYKYFENRDDDSAENFINTMDDPVAREFEKAIGDPMEVAVEYREEARDLKAKVKYRPVFMSENAITLSDKVQLITRFYGSPAELHGNYDFVHCMCYYDHSANMLTLPPAALESLLSKALVYKGSLYPIASIFRTRKFIARGWKISAGQMLKMIWQLNGVDLNDRQLLREQLLGVDQAYMHELLRELENEKGRIDSTYLANLIDRIFENV